MLSCLSLSHGVGWLISDGHVPQYLFPRHRVNRPISDSYTRVHSNLRTHSLQPRKRERERESRYVRTEIDVYTFETVSNCASNRTLSFARAGTRSYGLRVRYIVGTSWYAYLSRYLEKPLPLITPPARLSRTLFDTI